MRKIIAFLAAGALLLCTAGLASAAHQGLGALQTTGYIKPFVSYIDNVQFEDEDSQIDAAQRLVQYFSYAASDNLSATVAYEIDSVWGRTNEADIGADATAQLELKRSNLQFTWPGTKTQIKAGIQRFALPSGAYGVNPVMFADMAGVTVSTPLTEMANLSFGWARGAENVGNNAAPGLDLFFATLPVGQDGWSVNPYAMYGAIGQATNPSDISPFTGFHNPNGAPALADSASVWWLGSSLDITAMDPMVFKGSAIYGSLNTDQDVNERAGYYADFSASYKMERMTPEVFAMYSSGEDDDFTDGSETMPFIWNDTVTYKNPSVLIGTTFLDRTHSGFNTMAGLQISPIGLWSVGVTINNIAVTEKLYVTPLAAYYQGTGDKAAAGTGTLSSSPWNTSLTEEDSAFEIGVSNNYHIYENLMAVLELNYAQADYDEDTWRNNYKDDAITRAAMGLNYSF